MPENENTPAAGTSAQSTSTTPAAAPAPAQGQGQAQAPAAAVDPAAEAPKYTDKQLNDLIAREATKREAATKAAIMKELGVDTPEALAELKKLREEKMTESERAAASLKAKDDAVLAARADADAARAEVEAFKAGISAENLAKAIKLAGTYDGATMAEKIAAVVADFPMLKGKAGATAGGGSLGVETKHEELSEVEAMLAKARKQAGLTK